MRNAHHDFEHMCRHIARHRICSNILPATGPVAAGGDQGRDFESFRTYIHESTLSCSSFVGLASEGPVVFGCTLQKNSVATKIKDDIKLIMAPKQNVASIHIFAACEIPVGKRHELQTWAHTHHGVHLEILDALALSELLCSIDIFWIAEQYLSIPSEFRPHHEASEEDEWYTVALDRWTNSTDVPTTPANFHELVSAIRYATFTDNAKSDLPLWLTYLRRFQHREDCPDDLHRRATYEIGVASLRGLGTMEGLEQDLRRYFSGIGQLELCADLEDAGVLLQYCMGACHNNALQLTLNEIWTLEGVLENRLRQQIRVSQSNLTKCMLLEALGYTRMMFPSVIKETAPPDLNETARLWGELLDLAVEAPLYPLERFADRVTEIIRLFGYAAPLEDLTNKLDELLAKRSGGFKAAEKCRDRSLALREREQILEAINELHRAKIAWFADETLGGAILTMMMLCTWYLDVGLTYAAKQYAMAAAYISMQSSKKEVKRYAPAAFMLIGRCDYAQGCWCDFIGSASAAMLSYNLVPNYDQDQETINSQLEEISYHTAIALLVAERFSPEWVPRLQQAVADWSWIDTVDEALDAVRNAWSTKNASEVWDDLEQQLFGRPFGDVGTTRKVVWSQLGLTWSISWDNSYVLTAITEQFIATAQVFMAELADSDLCLLRSRIEVSVQMGSKEESSIQSKASNKRREWTIDFSRRSMSVELEDVQKEAFGFVVAIIREVSLLPGPEFDSFMSRSFKKGIVSKIQIARPYEQLYRSCVLDPRPLDIERRTWRTPQTARSFAVPGHQSMAWVVKPGPGYGKKSSEEQVGNRYNTTTTALRYTLTRLSESTEFMDVVRKLRHDGWLDWHILLGVANITWHHRVASLEKQYGASIEELKHSMSDAIDTEESVDTSAVAIEEYTEDAMRMALRLSQMATVKNLGLECHQQTPDFGAIDDFLRHRFNYWTDDVVHENPFPDG